MKNPYTKRITPKTENIKPIGILISNIKFLLMVYQNKIDKITKMISTNSASVFVLLIHGIFASLIFGVSE